MKTQCYHVTYRADGHWGVQKTGNKRVSSLHSTQGEAVQAARHLAQQAKGELKIHGTDDRLRESFSYGVDSNNASSKKPQVKIAASSEKKTAKLSVPETPSAESLAQRIGERLRRARLMSGHSLRSLAESIRGSVSHTMLQKYEAGEACPDTQVLARLAQALNLRPDFFFKKSGITLQTVEYRSQTKLGAKCRQRLEEQAFEFFERYLEIESILDLPPQEFPQADLSALKPEQLGDAIEAAADKLREEWELGMNPIPNVHAMLENYGVKVRVLPHEEGFDGFSAFASGDGLRMPVIALSERWLRGTEADLPRFRFTAVHELAHLHLILPSSLSPREKENCCHRFAGAFLIPRSAFQKVFGINRVNIALAELRAIKAEWGVSVAAIMNRACKLGLVTEGRYKTYCIVAAKNGWRVNDPGKWVGSEESNRFKPLVLRALAQELITTSKAAGLLQISLPELGEAYKPVA